MELVHRAERDAAAAGPDAELVRLRAVWGAYPFKHATDRLAVKAALDIAADFGKLTIALSVRDLADRIGVTSVTAHYALHRVRALGWLTLARHAHRSHATLFRVTAPRMIPLVTGLNTENLNLSQDQHLNQNPQSVQSGDTRGERMSESVQSRDIAQGDTAPSENVQSRDIAQVTTDRTESVQSGDRTALLVRALAHVDPEHDVWRRGALGKPCMVCFAALLEVGETTARELDARLRLPGAPVRRYVRRHLTTLRAYGLATCSKGRWRPVHVSLEELDRIAASFGMDGKGQRQQERHARQRTAHRAQVEADAPVVAPSELIAMLQLSWTVVGR